MITEDALVLCDERRDAVGLVDLAVVVDLALVQDVVTDLVPEGLREEYVDHAAAGVAHAPVLPLVGELVRHAVVHEGVELGQVLLLERLTARRALHRNQVLLSTVMHPFLG